jgi:AcrR family transcriptional regulator
METMLPEQNNIATYQEVRAYGRELLRRNVIEAASRLLREEGPEALTVRRVAQTLDCSTKIIYTMFKGKDGLADALYLEGCAGLAHTIAQVPKAATPVAYLRAVAWAYWTFALARPSFYLVMFCGAIPHYQPSATSLHTTATAFEVVIETLQRYQQEQALSANDNLALLTRTFWATLHGVVSLHLLGHFSSEEEAKTVFERALEAMILSLFPQP